MNVLIVGGAGYLGGALTDILMQTDHVVRVYDALLYEESYRKVPTFFFGDVRDTERLRPHLEWADCVVWLAALVGDPACALNERLTMDINVHALERAAPRCKRIICMSSCSVYGASDGVLDEQSPLHPLSLYAKTKIWGEEILASHPSALQLRLGTLYGISDAYARIRFDLVVNTLTMRAVLHKKMSVFGGRQYRPFVHVRDIATLIAAQLSTATRGIYNAHAENITILELAERIHKYVPSANIERSETMTQDNRNYRASSARAEKDLSFHPRLTIDDGIGELQQLLESGRVKNSFVARFSNYQHLKPFLQEYELPFGKVQARIPV